MEKIDVIVPTKNDERTLEECLEALKRQEGLGKIIVVDGYSRDRTVEIAEKHGCEIYYEPKTRNKRRSAEARNEGLKHSSTRLIAFIDADTIVPEGWLKTLSKYFRDDKVASVTSGCVWKGKTSLSWAINRCLQFGSSHARSFKKITRVESTPGYNALYLRRAVDEAGGFDESLGGCEDWELNYRLRKNGWKLLGVPECPVEHRERGSLRGFWRQMYHYAWARARVIRKKHIITPLHFLPSIYMLLWIFAVLFYPLLTKWMILFSMIGLAGVIPRGCGFKRAGQFILCFAVQQVAWAIGFLHGLLR